MNTTRLVATRLLAWLVPAGAMALSACATIAGLQDYPDGGGGGGTTSGSQSPSAASAGGSCDPPEGIGGGDPAPVGPPTVIADRQKGPKAIAVYAGKVYWATEDDQTLWRVDTSMGGKPESLFTTAPAIVHDLAVDDQHVYFTASAPRKSDCPAAANTDAYVGKLPNDHAATMDMLNKLWTGSSCFGAQGIFVNASTLYWTQPGYNDASTLDDYSVWQMPKSGDNPRNHIPKQVGAISIWVDTTNAYWSNKDESTIRFADTTNFSADTTHDFASHTDAVDLTGDGTSIYWITKQGDVNKLDKAHPGGPFTTLASRQGPLTSIAVDGDYVYFTVPSAGQIRRVALDVPEGGCPDVEIILDDMSNDATRVVVDESRIYWTAYNAGKVFYMTKKP